MSSIVCGNVYRMLDLQYVFSLFLLFVIDICEKQGRVTQYKKYMRCFQATESNKRCGLGVECVGGGGGNCVGAALLKGVLLPCVLWCVVVCRGGDCVHFLCRGGKTMVGVVYTSCCVVLCCVVLLRDLSIRILKNRHCGAVV